MTLTATYTSDLCRVKLVVASAPAAADYTKFERSTDQINWVTVRGGEAVPLVSQACTLNDDEFVPNVLNYYRASNVDTTVTFVAAGTAATGNNASVTPAHPAGLAVGDVKLIWASIRNQGVGVVNVPTGWTKLLDAGNAVLLGKVHASADTAPAVTFTGGVTNADTIAQMAAFRNMTLATTAAGTAKIVNASGQSIFVPQIPITAAGAILFLGWKQDDWTSVTTPTFGSKIGDTVSTAGDDAGLTWTWFATVGPPVTPAWGAQTMTVVGGAAAISIGATAAFGLAPFVTRDTTTITPTLVDSTGVQRVWIKNIQRPYLNTPLMEPVGKLAITRKSRSGLIPVVGRSKPVAVTDVRGAQGYTLGAVVATTAERDRLDLILSPGEPILVQYPPNIRLKSIYAVVGDTDFDDETSTYSLPLDECAAPAASIVGVTVLWSDIIASFATWSDVIAHFPTWGDVLNYTGSPTDIITG